MADRLSRAVRKVRDQGAQDVAAAMLEELSRCSEQAAGDWEDFHWGDPAKHASCYEIDPPPPVLFELGDLVSVTYDTSKGGENAHWCHDFHRPRPKLAYGGDQLWVLGGKYFVTDRGIER